MNFGRFWNSVAAGVCGSLAHTLLMGFKSWAGLLPSFEPYDDLQSALTRLIGSSVSPAVVWTLSYFNGSLVLSFLFGRVYRLLPARTGAAKGAIFGFAIWLVMAVTFFPAIGKGLFAAQTPLGLAPTAFSLAMVMAYSITLGITYAVFMRRDPEAR